jgi:hypothetical protein
MGYCFPVHQFSSVDTTADPQQEQQDYHFPITIHLNEIHPVVSGMNVDTICHYASILYTSGNVYNHEKPYK